jgi:hypothetical protein
MGLESLEEGYFDFKGDVSFLVVLTRASSFPNPGDSPSSGAGSPAIANSVGRPYAELIDQPSDQFCGSRLPVRDISTRACTSICQGLPGPYLPCATAIADLAAGR